MTADPLLETIAKALHNEFSARPMHSISQREYRVAQRILDRLLSDAGYEVVPTVLVQAVLDAEKKVYRCPNVHAALSRAGDALRAYREQS